MLASGVQAQTVKDNHAGWHLVCNDSLQGANVKAALEYLSMKGKKAKQPVVVGIIDSGADTLLANISNAFWTNPNERRDGKDNDRNGYVDDIRLELSRHARWYIQYDECRNGRVSTV